MKGWLIVNGFLRTEKYRRMYALLQNAAKKFGIELLLKWGDELIGDSFVLDSERPDFALFWDKDILLAKRLENAGLRLFNSAAAVENCDNKMLTALCLDRAGLPTPKTVFAPKTFEGIGYNRTDFFKRAEEMLGYPMIVKEAYGSFGRQVYLIHTREEALALFLTLGHKEFLMQEFIKESEGRDIRVNVVGRCAVSAIKRVNTEDFRSNISGGGRAEKIEITKEQEALAVAACVAVGADFAGVDLLFGKDGKTLVCEVNSNPHFESSIACTGVDVSEEIMRYVFEELL